MAFVMTGKLAAGAAPALKPLIRGGGRNPVTSVWTGSSDPVVRGFALRQINRTTPALAAVPATTGCRGLACAPVMMTMPVRIALSCARSLRTCAVLAMGSATAAEPGMAFVYASAMRSLGTGTVSPASSVWRAMLATAARSCVRSASMC